MNSDSSNFFSEDAGFGEPLGAPPSAWQTPTVPPRLVPLPDTHPFIVSATCEPLPVYRPAAAQCTRLQPYMCTPMGGEVRLQQNLTWRGWTDPKVCLEELQLSDYERVFPPVPEQLFVRPRPAPTNPLTPLEAVLEVARVTDSKGLAEDFLTYSALLFWLMVRGRVFARAPLTPEHYNEQLPPYVFVLFNSYDMATAHAADKESRWAVGLIGHDRDLALQLSFADFIQAMMVRYVPRHRNMAAFTSHSLGKNSAMMLHARCFGRVVIDGLLDHFRAAALLENSKFTLHYDVVHMRAGEPLYVRKERASSPKVCVPALWTHLLLQPGMQLVPDSVAAIPTFAERACSILGCLNYFRSPQEQQSLRQKLAPIIRQRDPPADVLKRCIALGFGAVDAHLAPLHLTAVRMRYTTFVDDSLPWWTPPLHSLPHWKLFTHDEGFIDETIAHQLTRLAPLEPILFEAGDVTWPNPVSEASALARRFLTYRGMHNLTEAEAWAKLKPDWKALGQSLKALRAEAGAGIRELAALLAPPQQVELAARLTEWDHVREIDVDYACPRLAACLRFFRPRVLVPLSNQSSWFRGLDSDYSARAESNGDLLRKLVGVANKATALVLRPAKRKYALATLQPGVDRLAPDMVAMLQLLQHNAALPEEAKRNLATVEAHARASQSTTLTAPCSQIYHSLYTHLRDLGTLPQAMLEAAYRTLAEHMIPAPLNTLDHLLDLVLRDHPNLVNCLPACARGQAPESVFFRLACGKRLKPNTQHL